MEEQDLKLSAATWRKQRASHRDVTPADYAALPSMLAQGELRVRDKSHFYLIAHREGDPWFAVIKRTQNGRNAYLVSYRRTHQADLERHRVRSRLLREER